MELDIVIVVVGLAAAWLFRRALRSRAHADRARLGCHSCAGCAAPPVPGCAHTDACRSPLPSIDRDARRKA